MGGSVLAFFTFYLYSKTVQNELIDKSVITVPKPGVRYFFTENGGSKQSFWSEVLAVFISFFFSGIVPLLIILFFVGWLSVRARRSSSMEV